MRIPASFCGVIGFRPSHGAVSMIGVLPNSQSLDTVGMLGTSSCLLIIFLLFFHFLILLCACPLGIFTRDPSILHHVGHVLLQLKSVETKRARRLIFADDLFQLSKVPTEKTVQVVAKAIERLSGCKLPDLRTFVFIGHYSHYYFFYFLNINVKVYYKISLLLQRDRVVHKKQNQA